MATSVVSVVAAATSAVASLAAFLPVTLKQLDQTLAFAGSNPDKATVYRSPTSVSVQIHDTTGMPPMDLSALFVPMSGILVVAALLLAAAVTRRLHDRGLSGFWALIPVALYGVGLIFWMRMMASIFADVSAADDASFMIDFMLNFLVLMLGQLSMIGLVVVTAMKGKTGPNRYGPEPV